MELKKIKILLILITILAIGEWVGLLQPVRAGGEFLTNFSLALSTKLIQATKAPIDWIFLARHNVRKIQDLERRYSALLAQTAGMEYLVKENESLKQSCLMATESASRKLLLAQIIGFNPPTVNAGTQEAVHDQSVVLARNTLIGLIAKAGEHQSTVSLLSANYQWPILAKTESGVEGLIIGDGKSVIMTELPADQIVKVDEKVMTVGQTGIRGGIFIGQIGSLDLKPAAATYQARIYQDFSFYEEGLVAIE